MRVTNFVCFFGRLRMTWTILPGGCSSSRSLVEADGQSTDPMEHSVSAAALVSNRSNIWLLHGTKELTTLHWKPTKYNKMQMQDLTTKTSITQHCHSTIKFLTLTDECYFRFLFSRQIFQSYSRLNKLLGTVEAGLFTSQTAFPSPNQQRQKTDTLITDLQMNYTYSSCELYQAESIFNRINKTAVLWLWCYSSQSTVE